MRSKNWTAYAALAGLGLASVGFLNRGSNAQAPIPRPKTAWEYLIDGDGQAHFHEALAKHGNDGWELVTATRSNGGSTVYVFKRPK